MSERTIDGLAGARARERTGGQKPKLAPRQVKLARQMYDETDQDGKRAHTVAQIAAEFGVSRPTIYRHLTTEDRRRRCRALAHSDDSSVSPDTAGSVIAPS